jgi:hypothetical protein
METAKELRAGEEWHSQWEANFDNARDECMTEADNIVMEVEHIVGDLDQRLDVQNTEILADALKALRELADYTYHDTIYGRYATHTEEFIYDFRKDMKMIAQDRLSYELKFKGER